MSRRFRNFTAADWRKKLTQLRGFRRKHGHSDVQSEWESYPELAGWAKHVRQNVAKLSDKQRDELLKNKFFTASEETWLEMYRSLRIFTEVMGHPHVPIRWKRNPALSRWVDMQREKQKRGTLEDYKVSLLEALDFRWRQRSIQREPWDVRYEQLMEYKDEYGDCNVPAKYDLNRPLGAWVSSIRLGQNKITQAQKRKLNKLGFNWDPLGDVWEQNFKALKAYKKEQGHCLVPESQDKSLALWIQNTRCRVSVLSEQQKKRLDALGFDWDPHETAWNEQYAVLVKFEKKYGHVNVGQTGVNASSALRNWVSTQRDKFKKGSLPADRQERLEALGFIWDVREALWEQRFTELEAYKKRFGDCRVPAKAFKENPSLGGWCSKMRTDWKTLPRNKKSRLKALGFEPVAVWARNH